MRAKRRGSVFSRLCPEQGPSYALCSALSVPGWLTSALEPLRNKHAQPPELEGMLLGNQEMWLSLRDGLGIETA